MHTTPSRRRFGLLALAGLAALGLAVAQQTKPQDETGTVFHIDTRVVVCNTTVVDKAGHLVTTLKQDAFSVFENNVRQQIQAFKHEDVPVSLGLVIDNSGSMKNKRAAVEAAALALVKESNPDDEVFVVNFNDEAYLDNPQDKPFLTDIEEMKQALTRIDARGGTAMRDAVQMAINWLKKAHKQKKVLVVVTDGEDNASDPENNTLEKVVRAARQSEVLIYAVGLLGEEDKGSANNAKKQLNALTEATGGQAFYPKGVTEVDGVAHHVARDIRNQYTIVYIPSNQTMDGTFRRIKVTVKASGNPTPRTRTGYYATPDEGSKVAVPASNFRR